jgi:hypothetical protein
MSTLDGPSPVYASAAPKTSAAVGTRIRNMVSSVLWICKRRWLALAR